MAAEHTQLSKAVSAEYDARKAKRLAELSVVITALRRWEGADTVCCMESG